VVVCGVWRIQSVEMFDFIAYDTHLVQLADGVLANAGFQIVFL